MVPKSNEENILNSVGRCYVNADKGNSPNRRPRLT